MKSYVAISNDLTVAVTAHDSALNGGISPTIEAPVPIFWPPGMVTGHNKLTYNVLHQGLPLAQKGHDCGPLIPHAHAIPDPFADALLTIQSSRKSMFSSSTVRGQKQPLAACSMLDSSPTPMLACADPTSVAAPGAVTLFKNTVTFGMTEMDISNGYADMVSEMLVDTIGSAMGAKRGSLVGWAFKTLGKNAKKFGQQGYKWATEDDAALDFSLEIDAPVVGGNVFKRWSGPRRDADGDWSWVEAAQAGPYKMTMDFEPIDGLFGNEDIVEVEVDPVRAFDRAGNVSVKRDGKIVTYESGLGGEGDLLDPAKHGRVRIEEDEP